MKHTRKTYASHYEKMTTQPVPSLLISLAIPTIITMMVSSIYNMADAAFVGQLGTSASGAVGVVSGFMAILQAVGFLFGQGSGSILSRKLGAKDTEGATATASTGFFCALALSILVAVLSFIFLDPLVHLLGSTDTIAPYAKDYIRYILLAAPATVTSFSMNNFLRYEGKAMLGMIGMMVGVVLNIFGDPILMFVFGMGIAGAGLSTCIAQYISFFILISMFLRGKTQSRISIRCVKLKTGLIPDIVSTGFPSLLRQGLNSLSTILLNMQAAVYGDAAVAAMSIVSRIVFFVFSIALGIGQGFQPISAFNYGAGKYSRLRKAFFTSVILAEGVIAVITVCVLLKADSLVAIFRDDPEVIAIGTRTLKLQLLAQLVLPLCSNVEMLHQSTGKKLGAAILSGMRSGFLFIPCLLILPYFRGLSGLQEAQPVAFALSVIPAVLMGIRYLRRLPKEDSPTA